MRKKFVLPVLLAVFAAMLTFGGCRSEYEKIRTAGDPETIRKKAFEYYDEKDYVKAQSLLELSLPSFKGKKEAEEIYYRYTYTYYHTRQYLLASYYFNSFVQTFGGSPYKEEMAFMSAYSNYKMSPTFRLDQTHTLKAIEDFQLFTNTYPESERVAECNKLIDELRSKLESKAYDEGELY
ncbi:MAG: outer membrane protein assembly factor BamD, partial [Saprospiraceae bacterium]|nr:outer membrane protein assembly factor BamD [Saprospiraceae bacterium]